MTYFVVLYPEFKQSDFKWIQNYRGQYDRQFSLVKPHFTLVFAIQDFDKEQLLSEVKQKVADVEAFDFELKVATVNQDDSGEYYHEFLVPDTGYSNIVKLHDKLYSDLLAPRLRLDVDFIPHISIGDSKDAQISKRRVDDLNSQNISIHGHINSVDIIEYVDGAINTVEKIQLQ